MPTNLASNTSSWPSTTLPDFSSSMYGGCVWLGDPRHDEARLGSLFDAPGGNADSSGLNPMGTGVAAPVLEQAFPTAPRALPSFQPCPPPSLNWPRAPGAPWQPTSSWDHPVHTARQHNSHSSSIGSFAMRPESLPVQLATSSVITGRSERRFMPTGPLPSNSVQTLTLSDPVPVACTFLFAVVNFFFVPRIRTHVSHSVRTPIAW